VSPFGVAQWAALALVPFAAFVAWPRSKPISGALWLVFAAGCAYVALAQDLPTLYRLGKLEPLRWVAIAPGLAGVYELARRADLRVALDHRRYEKARDEAIKQGVMSDSDLSTARAIMKSWRVDLLALACVASMASDGAALLGYKVGLEWSAHYVQIVVLLAMIAVCAWPGKEAEP
jgi:hypothetical protein